MQTAKVIRILLAVLLSGSFVHQSNAQELPLPLDSARLSISNQFHLDSLHEGIFQIRDSIERQFSIQLDSITKQFLVELDSATNKDLVIDLYTRKTDSLYGFVNDQLARIKKQTDPLEKWVHGQLSKSDSIVHSKMLRTDSLLRINGINVTSRRPSAIGFPTELPNPGIHWEKVPKINAKEFLKIPALVQKEDSQFPWARIPDVESEHMGDIQSIKDKLNELGGRTEKYKGSFDQVADINKDSLLAELGTEVEKQLLTAEQLNEMNTLFTQAQGAKEKQEEAAKSLSDLEQVKQQAKKEFTDHFKDKEEIVKKDLDDIAKIQMKYRDVKDSRFLPKRPPNEMKEKAFVERLIPGITLQTFTGKTFMADVAPSIGYQFSGKIRAGFGGFRRLAYLEKEKAIEAIEVHGARVFNNVRLYKSFFSHAEFELYKQHNVSHLQIINLKDTDGWRNKFNFGLYHSYSMGKHFNGHVIILYDLLMVKEFPNTKNSAVRFGFDYRIIKRKKKEPSKQ